MKAVLHQNYFQYDKYYKPSTGMAMGCPLSSTATERLFQYYEKLIIKHWLEAHDIVYYRRYVDDILIIFDQSKTDVTTVTHHLNSFHQNVAFTPTPEEHNINYLDLSIHKGPRNLQLRIYRKPTQTNATIHFMSTHPIRQKLAAYHFYTNRMLFLPTTNHDKLHEWNVICNIARNNGFPSQLIHNLRRKFANKRATQALKSTAKNGTWVTFTFDNPLVHKVTNLFKNTNVNIAFRSTNTIYHQLQHHPIREPSKLSGIYKLQCMTCNKSYVGQSG
jgi:hypothetical protein